METVEHQQAKFWAKKILNSQAGKALDPQEICEKMTKIIEVTIPEVDKIEVPVEGVAVVDLGIVSTVDVYSAAIDVCMQLARVYGDSAKRIVELMPEAMKREIKESRSNVTAVRSLISPEQKRRIKRKKQLRRGRIK